MSVIGPTEMSISEIQISSGFFSFLLSYLCPTKPHHSCSAHRCYVDDKVSKVAWLNRSNIIFAGQDKWSLDPRVDLVTKGQLEYSLRIQKVTEWREWIKGQKCTTKYHQCSGYYKEMIDFHQDSICIYDSPVEKH